MIAMNGTCTSHHHERAGTLDWRSTFHSAGRISPVLLEAASSGEPCVQGSVTKRSSVICILNTTYHQQYVLY